MALDGTYSGLKTSVADWLNRADLTAIVPDFIALAEAQISRRLIIQGAPREMMGRADATVNDEFVSTPSDFMGIRALYLSGSKEPLEFSDDPEKIIELKAQYPTVTGDPQLYAIVGGELQFWPWVSGGSYSAEITYWKRIPSLSDTLTTNWLLLLHPDAYLYGSLLQAAPYLKNDERVGTWGTFFTTIISDISTAGKFSRTAPHIAIPERSGGTP